MNNLCKVEKSNESPSFILVTIDVSKLLVLCIVAVILSAT